MPPSPTSPLLPPSEAAQARARLEHVVDQDPRQLQALDGLLLALHDLETSEDGLPAVVGGIRRVALLEADPISTSWLGTCPRTGTAAVVRCLRPASLRDPVWHRRLERGARLTRVVGGLVPLDWHGDDPWPHVRALLPGTLLEWLLPAEDPPDPAWLVRLVGRALATLDALHTRGIHHGGLTARHVILQPPSIRLLWMDPVRDPSPPSREDVRAVSRLALASDPTGTHPMTDLVTPWLEAPPDHPRDALLLLREAMAHWLTAERHRLLLQSRTRGRRSGSRRLHAACVRLGRTLPPPTGRCCFEAGADGTFVLVESDGRSVHGGRSARLPPPGLPLVWSPDRGLDAPAARQVLRAWAGRAADRMAEREAAQRAWGGSEAWGEAIVRWLTAQSRLRTARLLLERGVLASTGGR